MTDDKERDILKRMAALLNRAADGHELNEKEEAFVQTLLNLGAPNWDFLIPK